jgi:hypothetical protein
VLAAVRSVASASSATESEDSEHAIEQAVGQRCRLGGRSRRRKLVADRGYEETGQARPVGRSKPEGPAAHVVPPVADQDGAFPGMPRCPQRIASPVYQDLTTRYMEFDDSHASSMPMHNRAVHGNVAERGSLVPGWAVSPTKRTPDVQSRRILQEDSRLIGRRSRYATIDEGTYVLPSPLVRAK